MKMITHQAFNKLNNYRINSAHKDEQIEELFQLYRKYGFPNYDINGYSKEQEFAKLKDFDELSLEQDDKLKQTMHGCGFLWTYFPHWTEVKYNNGKSVVECWDDDELLRKLIAKTYNWQEKHGNGIFTVNRVRQNAKVYCSKQSVSNFRPTVAKYIMNKYGNNGTVWDMCCGWGGRLFGFLSSDMQKYIGTEPSRKTFEGLVKLKNDYSYIGKQVELHNECAEDFVPEKESVDLCFTSPPYFDTERYAEEPTQSFIKFNSYSQWSNNFLKKVIENCWCCLKQDGTLAINICNTPKYDRLESDTIKYAEECGFKLVYTHKMILSSIAGKGEKYEPIFIFKKASK